MLYIDIGVICLCVALFGFSVFKGLEKGIKNLSNCNMLLALLFLTFVFISSDGSKIFNSAVSGIHYSVNYFWENEHPWNLRKVRICQGMDYFYWAWWVAFGPLVGLFIARISKGRNLRQVILGMLFLEPSVPGFFI